ncbi:hypothetical protein RM780_06620 [Streptomyces sp. DSM 44917]|uniref:Maltokinase n=1 Tax=Streptomyces boetiae TaxID=3075541 RepID=A0ABU2L4Z7_9ACTN|nr:hypothetical protein [Streptomyces sp. DSM 44917]MDT0306634.1 hypothetical protein [Streptomyces sp. DSM 44917]
MSGAEGVPAGAVLATPGVAAALGAWMAGQRWYAGAGPASATVLATREFAPGGDGRAAGVLALAGTGAGGGDYLLPLGVGPEAERPAGAPALAVADGAVVWDALADPRLTTALVRRITAGEDGGGLRYWPGPSPASPPAGEAAMSVRPLGVEQTNSSVVVAGRYLLKVFRRPAPGPGRDLTLHRALAEAGSAYVPPLLGAASDAGDGTTYATLQRYLPDAADGWGLALRAAGAFVRGGPAVPFPARGLGVAVAAVHRDLAAAGGRSAPGREDLRRLAEGFVRRLERAVADAPALERHVPWLRAGFAAVTRRATAGARPSQWIHGDLHLGQTLRSGAGWLLLDFEGEPLATPEERDRPDSPLRDLAGMLRSFDYAAHHGLAAAPDGPAGRRALARAARWAELTRRAFLDGYAAAAGRLGAADRRLLDAYVLDKAVYEVAYETRHRPGWAWLPLAALDRAAAGPPPGAERTAA